MRHSLNLKIRTEHLKSNMVHLSDGWQCQSAVRLTSRCHRIDPSVLWTHSWNPSISILWESFENDDKMQNYSLRHGDDLNEDTFDDDPDVTHHHNLNNSSSEVKLRRNRKSNWHSLEHFLCMPFVQMLNRIRIRFYIELSPPCPLIKHWRTTNETFWQRTSAVHRLMTKL